METLKSAVQLLSELVNPSPAQKSACITPVYIDDNEKDVVYVAFLYEGDNVIRRHAFRDHMNAEELVKNWTTTA